MNAEQQVQDEKARAKRAVVQAENEAKRDVLQAEQQVKDEKMRTKRAVKKKEDAMAALVQVRVRSNEYRRMLSEYTKFKQVIQERDEARQLVSLFHIHIYHTFASYIHTYIRIHTGDSAQEARSERRTTSKGRAGEGK